MAQSASFPTDGHRDDDHRAPPARPVDLSQCYRTFAGTICKGMEVVDAGEHLIGHVDSIEGDRIRLALADGAPSDDFLPFSLIAGISKTRISLAARGDASFGLGAQP